MEKPKHVCRIAASRQSTCEHPVQRLLAAFMTSWELFCKTQDVMFCNAILFLKTSSINGAQYQKTLNQSNMINVSGGAWLTADTP